MRALIVICRLGAGVSSPNRHLAAQQSRESSTVIELDKWTKRNNEYYCTRSADGKLQREIDTMYTVALSLR